LTIDLATVPVDEDPDGILLREAVAQHAANTPMAGLWYSMPYRDSISHLTGNAFWDEVAIWRYVDAIRKAGIATYLRGNWKDEPTSDVLIAAHNLDSRLWSARLSGRGLAIRWSRVRSAGWVPPRIAC